MTTDNLHTKIGAVRDAHAAYAALLPQVEAARAARDEAQAQLARLNMALRAAEKTLDDAQFAVTRQWRRELWNPADDEETTEAPKYTWHGNRLFDTEGRHVAEVEEANDLWSAFEGTRCIGRFISRDAAVAAVNKSVTPRGWPR